MIENQTRKKVETLIIDNGLEFYNMQPDNLYTQSGIKRHKYVPYTPHKNGEVERMNMTLLENLRSMMAPSGLSKRFWDEAAVTAANLINRFPSVPLIGKCPKFIVCDKHIASNNLNVSGCATLVHKSGDKLEPRAKKCIFFLGYPEGVKGYRLLDRSEPNFKTVIIRDVTFNEPELPYFSIYTTSPSDVKSFSSVSNIDVI